jgi:glycolate oxidase FAD binding subunit
MTSWRVTASNSATPLPLRAANMVRPANLADAERVMKAAAGDGRTVAFLGGGTEIGFGNPPERVDTLVRTDRLNGIVEYVPSDMIVTVEAGVTLADLQSTLAPHGQRLALDPPLPERATLGGLLATNAFGPRRARFGTLRDLIVGISFVRADGTRVRGGGKVVKNVAGFDLPKLMVGALGTLGLIATATFRLHPLPEASRWLRVVIPSASALREFCAAVRERKLEPSALLAFCTGHTFEACVLFEGFEAGVEEQSAALAALAAERTFPIDEASGDTVPQADENARQHGTLRLRLSAAPSDLELLCDVALAPLADRLNDCRIVIYPTLGTAFVSAERGEADEDAALVRAIRDARATLEARGGSLVILELAPPAFAEPLDRFGTLPDGFFLMQRLKERFDPERRLNRGRFLGGL